jgi:hypothetical protein
VPNHRPEAQMPTQMLMIGIGAQTLTETHGLGP